MTRPSTIVVLCWMSLCPLGGCNHSNESVEHNGLNIMVNKLQYLTSEPVVVTLTNNSHEPMMFQACPHHRIRGIIQESVSDSWQTFSVLLPDTLTLSPFQSVTDTFYFNKEGRYCVSYSTFEDSGILTNESSEFVVTDPDTSFRVLVPGSEHDSGVLEIVLQNSSDSLRCYSFCGSTIFTDLFLLECHTWVKHGGHVCFANVLVQCQPVDSTEVHRIRVETPGFYQVGYLIDYDPYVDTLSWPGHTIYFPNDYGRQKVYYSNTFQVK